MPTPPSERRPAADPFRDPEERRQETLQKIRSLQSRSSRGLWALGAFAALSVAARWEFRFLPTLPPGVRTFLGAPPPAGWISVALVVYSFSAIVLTLSRMMSGAGDRSGLDHLGYLTGFYVFYYFSGALADNFWAVLVAGVTILSLNAYSVWTHYSEQIGEEMERLARLEKRDKPSAEG